ncbi:hypothetical protein ACT17_22960 [Mycolicibacterium conceptionense]|uniref:Transmembrane protein n=1 Tax=Mycolicibacterium conceptionense TaxID=451644 RepID=A0A0J8U686_9MYCO|nr:hypothetical protein [Mycolicibacterium conceptionense]KMV15955.1 hypothetical protein ACT17_22960 [Mycolicibacterium conceptionense]
MSAPTTFSASERLRAAGIVAGYSKTSIVRLTEREHAALALTQVHNDADGHTYRMWRRVGSAIQLFLYLPTAMLVALFLVNPRMVTFLAALAMAGMEVGIQVRRRRISRMTIARAEHPAGKGRRRER